MGMEFVSPVLVLQLLKTLGDGRRDGASSVYRQSSGLQDNDIKAWTLWGTGEQRVTLQRVDHFAMTMGIMMIFLRLVFLFFILGIGKR